MSARICTTHTAGRSAVRSTFPLSIFIMIAFKWSFLSETAKAASFFEFCYSGWGGGGGGGVGVAAAAAMLQVCIENHAERNFMTMYFMLDIHWKWISTVLERK